MSLMRKLPEAFNQGKPPEASSQIGTVSRVDKVVMKVSVHRAPPATAALVDHREAISSTAARISTTPSR
ncbi:hypothetical protein D3C76_1846910 [compost metagenome]